MVRILGAARQSNIYANIQNQSGNVPGLGLGRCHHGIDLVEYTQLQPHRAGPRLVPLAGSAGHQSKSACRNSAHRREPHAAGPWPGAHLGSAEELTPEERVNVAVYDACNRSVVNIKTEASTTSMFLLDLVQEGTGSGSVLDDQGHILTNYHVVERGQRNSSHPI